MDGSLMVWIKSSGAPTFARPARSVSTTRAAVFLARGCGAKMMALRHFKAGKALAGKVASQFVTGVSAPITPTGLAILISLFPGFPL